MADEPRDQDILHLRDRMIERRPGLRHSFDRFLKGFEKYTAVLEGDSTAPGARKNRRQSEYEHRSFRA